jgi:hypothetical protein
MKQPFGGLINVAASGTGLIPGIIQLVRARTVTLTVQLTCGGGLTADPEIDVLYSPDGRVWDTIPFTYFTLAFTAGAKIQRTMILDPPEHGYLRLSVLNKSAADVLTDVNIWYGIQSWPPEPALAHGAIDTRTLDG